MNKAVCDGVSRKRSVRNIIASNAGAFRGLTQKTVYTYIKSGLFDIVRGDLPYACMRRKPKKTAETKTNAKCRVGRTYREYLAFLAANPGIRHVELDTVNGSVSGKVLFTMVFECGLALAFLKDHETSQTCTGIFNMLHRIAGPALFRRLFPVVLTDNGSCFSNPETIENARAENNPYKLIPRTKVFYCDAYCSSQKPHIERFHVELRRILVKGTSFNSLDQEKVARPAATGRGNSSPGSASSASRRTRSRSTRSCSASASSGMPKRSSCGRTESGSNVRQDPEPNGGSAYPSD